MTTIVNAADWGNHGCPVIGIVKDGRVVRWEGVCTHPECAHADGEGPMWAGAIMRAVEDEANR